MDMKCNKAKLACLHNHMHALMSCNILSCVALKRLSKPLVNASPATLCSYDDNNGDETIAKLRWFLIELLQQRTNTFTCLCVPDHEPIQKPLAKP